MSNFSCISLASLPMATACFFVVIFCCKSLWRASEISLPLTLFPSRLRRLPRPQPNSRASLHAIVDTHHAAGQPQSGTGIAGDNQTRGTTCTLFTFQCARTPIPIPAHSTPLQLACVACGLQVATGCWLLEHLYDCG